MRNVIIIKRRIVLSGGFLLGSGALFFASFIPGFFNIYTPWSKWISGAVGFVVSFAPFSVAEILLYGLILYLLYSLVRSIIRSVSRTGGALYLARFGVTLLAIASAAVFSFLAMWGLMYRAPPLEERLGFTVKEYGQSELHVLAEWLVTRVNEEAALVRRDEDGAMDASFGELAGMTERAVKKLAGETPVFSGGTVTRPKRVTAYIFMDYYYIGGIYSPFTGECNVNPNAAPAFLPEMMAHEMSHRLGIAPEEDAGFAAFLICIGAENPEVRYSGYWGALRSCLSKIDDEVMKAALYDALTPLVYNESRKQEELTAYMDKDLAKVTAAVSETVNDGYLKAMGQDDGVKSYGRMTDLLLAWYYSRSDSGE
ncbi:MAG: DUF3810 domain-containing protein [Oscillospiraceae bacterium]|jgi:hypothetical protein|nr:DUF3810 domain-containing protein [Oscillospiraceae bacterium]